MSSLNAARWPFVGVAVAGGVSLLVAVGSIAVFAVSLSGPSMAIDDGPQVVTLPADRSYGLYVDDADNSGYSYASDFCVIQDGADSVRLRLPRFSVSESETETLDWVFNTGSGQLTASCSIPGETVSLKPVPRVGVLVVGVGVGVVLGLATVGTLAVLLTDRRRRRLGPVQVGTG